MNSRDEFAIKTLRYLDEDLGGQELEDFLSHLHSCARCREQLEAEKGLSATLHRFRPLYSTPAALRDRVATAVQYPPASRVRGRIDRRPHRFFGERLSGVPGRLSNWRILTPAAAVFALCLALVPDVLRSAQAASYVDTAVAAHRSYLRGNLPFGLRSNSSATVTAWFAGKVPFDFRLPAAESVPQQNPAYRLTGATLVNFKGGPAALVTYEGQNGTISLLVDSSKFATVAGGDQVRFGSLAFHYHDDAGFRVITWNNHGLSYALVSSVSGPARASCVVCHQSMVDNNHFKTHQ